MPRKRPASSAVEFEETLTPPERAALDRLRARRAEDVVPRLTVIDQEKHHILLNKGEAGLALLMEATGVMDEDFLMHLLSQLGNAATRGSQIDEGELNFMLSMIKGLKTERSIGSDARRSDGGGALRGHESESIAGESRVHRTVRQICESAQQFHSDQHNAAGGAQALPDRREPAHHGPSCVGQ